jgi:deazaflavin-dependent oxidoreductase (nitroreductase family)
MTSGARITASRSSAESNAMNQEAPGFQRPSALERIGNKAFGVLVGLGLGLRHNYLLQVRGRKTGRVYSTPVNVLEHRGKRLLVAGRGRTQWVRNAEVAEEVALRKGWTSRRFRIRAVPDAGKPEVLSAYLDRFRLTVQRYFPVRAGSGPEAFAELADRYPVFELLPPSDAVDRAKVPTAAQR